MEVVQVRTAGLEVVPEAWHEVEEVVAGDHVRLSQKRQRYTSFKTEGVGNGSKHKESGT